MSGAWEYFVPIDSISAKCCKCNKTISTNQGSSSGMNRHLNIHKISVNKRLEQHNSEEEFLLTNLLKLC